MSMPGSNVIELTTTSHDFEAGQGILIQSAGNDSSMNNWLKTTVTAVNGNQLTLATTAKGGAYSTSVLHDDTDAVNAAISTGKSVYYFDVPEMNVKGVKLKSNTMYNGLDICTLYLPMAYSDVPYVQQMIEVDGVDNVTFKNFTVDGNKSKGLYATTEVGVILMKITWASGINVIDNTFQNSGYLAVNMRTTVSDILVEGNTILGTDVGIYAMPEYMGSLYLDNAVFRNNYIDGGTSEAISISSGLWNNVGYANNVLIENNVMKNKSATCVQLGSRTTNITVRNNDISGSNHGITTMDLNLEGLEDMIAENILIEGNKIHDNTWHNLQIDGYNVTIRDNEIYNGNDVLMLGRTYLDGAVVENNIFTNVGTSLGAISIFNLHNATIENNTFVSGNVAIAVREGIMSNVQVLDNDFGGLAFMDGYQIVSYETFDQRF